MAEMPAGSVDSIVTDPPYGLSFMGKGWDHGVPGVEFWREALRVAKPGAHLLAFGGTRTFHRLTVAIEDAGWEIRDCLMWVYGSGFPKSHNLQWEWQGWGTALKPAWEPIILARKPLAGTVAANVLEHGTGALNIDGCRVGTESGDYDHPGNTGIDDNTNVYGKFKHKNQMPPSPLGRWPANLIHDGSDEVVGLMAEAARFFYCAKASKRDRDEGCEGLVAKTVGVWGGDEDDLTEGKKRVLPARNHHPTVKPTDLMRYLCRLVTPPGGLVLDPFGGSGSTGKAALLEGFRVTLCELSEEYWPIIEARCKSAANERPECKVSAMVQRTLFSGD